MESVIGAIGIGLIYAVSIGFGGFLGFCLATWFIWGVVNGKAF